MTHEQMIDEAVRRAVPQWFDRAYILSREGKWFGWSLAWPSIEAIRAEFKRIKETINDGHAIP